MTALVFDFEDINRRMSRKPIVNSDVIIEFEPKPDDFVEPVSWWYEVIDGRIQNKAYVYPVYPIPDLPPIAGSLLINDSDRWNSPMKCEMVFEARPLSGMAPGNGYGGEFIQGPVCICKTHSITIESAGYIHGNRCWIGRIEDLEQKVSHLMPDRSNDI